MRLWGGKLARVVRALPHDRILVQDQADDGTYSGPRHTTSARWVTMVARPDGTAPTEDEHKVAEEDVRRDEDPNRGNGASHDDDGDPTTPNEPHDVDDQGRPIGDDHGDGPDAADDQPETADGAHPVNVDALSNRPNAQGARYADTAAVRSHFLQLADADGTSPEMGAFLRHVAHDDALQITPSGRYAILRDDQSGQWYLTATGTGQRINTAGDFASVQDAGQFATHLDDTARSEQGETFDFSDPALDSAARSWRSAQGENIQTAIVRARRDFDAAQAAPAPARKRAAARPAARPGQRFTTLQDVRHHWGTLIEEMQPHQDDPQARKVTQHLTELSAAPRLKLAGNGQFVIRQNPRGGWELVTTGRGVPMPQTFARQRDAKEFADAFIGTVKGQDGTPLDLSDRDVRPRTWRSDEDLNLEQVWTRARTQWDREHGNDTSAQQRPAVAEFRGRPDPASQDTADLTREHEELEKGRTSYEPDAIRTARRERLDAVAAELDKRREATAGDAAPDSVTLSPDEMSDQLDSVRTEGSRAPSSMTDQELSDEMVDLMGREMADGGLSGIDRTRMAVLQAETDRRAGRTPQTQERPKPPAPEPEGMFDVPAGPDSTPVPAADPNNPGDVPDDPLGTPDMFADHEGRDTSGLRSVQMRSPANFEAGDRFVDADGRTHTVAEKPVRTGRGRIRVVDEDGGEHFLSPDTELRVLHPDEAAPEAPQAPDAAPIGQTPPEGMTDGDIDAELEALEAWRQRHIVPGGEGPRLPMPQARTAVFDIGNRRTRLMDEARKRANERRRADERRREAQEKAEALTRADVGARNPDGSYPVSVDGADVGTVQQSHGRWGYTHADGGTSGLVHSSRGDAVAGLVRGHDFRRQQADRQAQQNQAREETPDGWSLGDRADLSENDVIRVPITQTDRDGRPYPVGWRDPVRVRGVNRTSNGSMVVSVENLDGSQSDLSPVMLSRPDDTFAWASDRTHPEPTPRWRHELRARMADIGDDIATLQRTEGLDDPERIQRLQDLIQHVERGDSDDLQGDLRRIRDETAWLEEQFDNPDLPYETRSRKSWATAAHRKAEAALAHPDFQHGNDESRPDGPDGAPDTGQPDVNAPDAPGDHSDEQQNTPDEGDSETAPQNDQQDNTEDNGDGQHSRDRNAPDEGGDAPGDGSADLPNTPDTASTDNPDDGNDENRDEEQQNDDDRRRRRRRRGGQGGGPGGGGPGGPGGPGLPRLSLPHGDGTPAGAGGDGTRSSTGRAHGSADALRDAWQNGDGLEPDEVTPERRAYLAHLAANDQLTLSPGGGIVTWPEDHNGGQEWHFAVARNGAPLTGITYRTDDPEQARALAGRFEQITDVNGRPVDWQQPMTRGFVASWRAPAPGERRRYNLPQALAAVQREFEQEQPPAAPGSGETADVVEPTPGTQHITLPDDLTDMSDEDLADAWSEGLSDDDQARVMAEMDRRDDADQRIRQAVPDSPPENAEQEQQRADAMDAALQFDGTDVVRPEEGSAHITLPDDLTDMSDQDLADAWSEGLSDDDQMRVMAEMDRRDDIDRQMRDAIPDTPPQSAAEELRRAETMDRLIGFNGTDVVRPAPVSESRLRTAFNDLDETRFRAAYEATGGRMLSPEGEQAGISERDVFSRSLGPIDQVKRYFSPELQEWFDSNGGRMTYRQYQSREQNRQLAAEFVSIDEARFLAAEEFTRGHMLSREGEAAGAGHRDVFSGGSMSAFGRWERYASEELREWFDNNGGRLSFNAFKERRRRDDQAARQQHEEEQTAQREADARDAASARQAWEAQSEAWAEQQQADGYSIEAAPADLQPGDEITFPVAARRAEGTVTEGAPYVATAHATVTGDGAAVPGSDPAVYRYPVDGTFTDPNGDPGPVSEASLDLGVVRRRPRPGESTDSTPDREDHAPDDAAGADSPLAETPQSDPVPAVPDAEPDAPPVPAPADDEAPAEAPAPSPDPVPGPPPEPIDGQPAQWARVRDLQPGDVVRMEGATRRGRPVTRAGHVYLAPVEVEVTRAGRTESMWRTWVTEHPDGSGQSGNIFTSLNATAARAEAPDDTVPGTPTTGAQSSIATGDLPDTIPTDHSGRGLFPGSTVTRSGGDEGTVTGATDSTVTVHWTDGDTETGLSPSSMTVTDSQRPDGWTAAGQHVRPGQLVSDDDGSLLGLVDAVDGDRVTVAAGEGTVSRSAADLRVTGEVRDETPETAPVTGIDDPTAAELGEGDVVVLDLDGRPVTAAITSPPHRDGDRITIEYADTTTGEVGELDVDATATVPRAQGGDGAPHLTTADAPAPAEDITVHEPAPVIEPVTGPTVDPVMSAADRDVVDDHAHGPDDNPDAQQAAARISNDLPVTPEQASALAEQLRASADPSEAWGRAALRAADALDQAAGQTPPPGLTRPQPSNAAQLADGDTVAMVDDRDGQVRVFRVLDAEDGPGGVRSLLLEDENQQWRRRIVHGAMPVWQLPEARPETATTPDPAPPAAPAAPEAPTAPVSAPAPEAPTAPVEQALPSGLRIGDVIDAPTSRGTRRLTVITAPQRNGWQTQFVGVDDAGNVYDFGLPNGRTVDVHERNQPTPALPSTGTPRDPNPAPTAPADQIVADHARAVAARIINEAIRGTEQPTDIHALREQIAQRLTAEALRNARNSVRQQANRALDSAGVTGDARTAAQRALRQTRQDAHTATVRAALRTINDLEPLPGESNEDLAQRAADLLRLIPDQIPSRPGAASGSTDSGITQAVTGHTDDALNAVVEQLQAAGLDAGDANQIARLLTGHLDGSRQATARRIAQRVAAASPAAGEQPGMLARIVALLVRLGKRLVEQVKAAGQKIAEKWRDSRERLARLRAFLGRLARRVRHWPESRRLARLDAAVDLPDVEGESLAARVSHWAGLMPDPGRFGQAQRRVTWWRPTTWGRLAAGRLPGRSDRIQWSPDRAADGGPGLTALRHMAALRAAGGDVDRDVTRRLAAALGDDFGGDPHGALQHADDYVASTEQRLVNLQSARTGATIQDPDLELEIDAARFEAATARREWEDLRSRYAAAVPDAVAEALAEIRDIGPEGNAGIVFGADSTPDAEQAARGVQRLLPRSWLAVPAARRLTAVDGDAGRYEPGTQRATIADLADGGVSTAAHALGQHFAEHVDDLDAAQRVFWFTQTHTGRPGARRMNRSMLSRILRRQQTQPETGDSLARSVQAMFNGDWYLDDDLRAFLLGLLATR
ncbi:hypothetical protein ACIP9H_33755 [Streptomyces sp. NPDC088732]|uniref:hypothetical protein n=1 Tax=Streptomyces sp. NPDC088732 TaxID=3365879 RepID=UPI00381EFF7D